MNNIITFEKEGLGKIRTTILNEVVWFLAKDVCDSLEVKNVSEALSRLDNDEKSSIILNEGIGNPEKSVINESGLYSLVLSSRKIEAKKFKKWVTSEVLPSIRKTGGYVQENRAIDFVSNWLPQLDDTSKLVIAGMLEDNKRLKLDLDNKEEIILEQKPKVEFADKLLKSKDCILVREFAKVLFDEGINIGEKRLYNWLRENKYIMKNNEPFQHNMKYFRVKENSIDTAFGVKITKTTLITPEGQLYFYSKLKDIK